MTTVPPKTSELPLVIESFSWAGFWSSVPDFILCTQFLLMWIDPQIIGAQFLPTFVGIMVAEFIVIHSSAFLGNVVLQKSDLQSKLRSIVGLGAMYSVFFLAISVAFGAWYYFFGFLLMTGNRLLGVILGQAPTGQELTHLRAGWAVTTITYLVGVFVTLFLPLPRFGITEAIQSQYMIGGSGVWVEEPHRAIVFGFLYFGIVGWSEIRMPRWIFKGLPTE